MKKLILVFMFMGFTQAQTTGWVKLSITDFINPILNFGVAGNIASPGDKLAILVTYYTLRDKIEINCETIYYLSSNTNVMKFKKYIALINIKKDNELFNSFSAGLNTIGLNSNDLKIKLSYAISSCYQNLDYNESKTRSLEYEIPFSNAIVRPQMFSSVSKVKYSVDFENNAHLEVIDAKPAQ